MKKLITLASAMILMAGCATHNYEWVSPAGENIRASEFLFFWNDDMSGFDYNHAKGSLTVQRRKTKTDSEALTIMAELVEKMAAAAATGGAASAAPAAASAATAVTQ